LDLMTLARLPLLRLFRTLVMGMLVLAVIGKPVLAELCNVHALTHAFASTHLDSAAEARSDSDHAKGAHQLLHAFEASAAFVELFPALTVPPARFTALAPPPHRAAAPAAHRFDSPFRPPIA
jgi:hypothetical protein